MCVASPTTDQTDSHREGDANHMDQPDVTTLWNKDRDLICLRGKNVFVKQKHSGHVMFIRLMDVYMYMYM